MEETSAWQWGEDTLHIYTQAGAAGTFQGAPLRFYIEMFAIFISSLDSILNTVDCNLLCVNGIENIFPQSLSTFHFTYGIN